MILGGEQHHPHTLRGFYELESRFREVHGDNYDYSKSIYLSMKTKIEIWCKVHNEYFWQTPDKHLQKRGCPRCGRDSSTEKTKTPFEEFVRLSNIKHNNKYIYLPDKYFNIKSKIDIICPIHGIFTQVAFHHMNNNDCPKCANITKGLACTKPYTDFLNEANKVHNNKYLYIPDSYKDSQTKMKIICPIHGEFLQAPNPHIIKGTGCPHCGNVRMRKKYYDEPTSLYYLRLNTLNNIYFKIGITKYTVSRRYKDLHKYPHILDYEILALKEFSTGKLAYTVEQEIVSTFKDLLTKDSVLVGNGNSEVFDKDIYPDIQHHFI